MNDLIEDIVGEFFGRFKGELDEVIEEFVMDALGEIAPGHKDAYKELSEANEEKIVGKLLKKIQTSLEKPKLDIDEIVKDLDPDKLFKA